MLASKQLVAPSFSSSRAHSLRYRSLLSLPDDILVFILEYLDGAMLGRVAQCCSQIRQLLYSRAEPWQAALSRACNSAKVPLLPAAARQAYMLLHCRAARIPRCPGCGRPVAPPRTSGQRQVVVDADISTRPFCMFLLPLNLTFSVTA